MTLQPKRIRNRKNVAVNQRNKRMNLFYKSKVRTLTKKLKSQIFEYTLLVEQSSSKADLTRLLFLIYVTYKQLGSHIDKAVGKKVFHKNHGANRKIKVAKLFRVNSMNPYYFSTDITNKS